MKALIIPKRERGNKAKKNENKREGNKGGKLVNVKKKRIP